MRTIKLKNKSIEKHLLIKDRLSTESVELTKNVVKYQNKINEITKKQEEESKKISSKFNSLKNQKKREDEKIIAYMKGMDMGLGEFEEMAKVYFDDKTGEVCIDITDAIEEFKKIYKSKNEDTPNK